MQGLFDQAPPDFSVLEEEEQKNISFPQLLIHLEKRKKKDFNEHCY